MPCCKKQTGIISFGIASNSNPDIEVHSAQSFQTVDGFGYTPAGSVRIESTSTTSLTSAAFKTPAGKKVLLVLNESTPSSSFNIKYKNKWENVTLPPASAGTFVR